MLSDNIKIDSSDLHSADKILEYNRKEKELTDAISREKYSPTIWYQYIKFLEERYGTQSQKRSFIFSLIEESLHKLHNVEGVGGDESFILINIKFALMKFEDDHNSGLVHFKSLLKRNIGTKNSCLYLSWAKCFETIGKFADAYYVIKTGITNDAQPSNFYPQETKQGKCIDASESNRALNVSTMQTRESKSSCNSSAKESHAKKRGVPVGAAASGRLGKSQRRSSEADTSAVAMLNASQVSYSDIDPASWGAKNKDREDDDQDVVLQRPRKRPGASAWGGKSSVETPVAPASTNTEDTIVLDHPYPPAAAAAASGDIPQGVAGMYRPDEDVKPSGRLHPCSGVSRNDATVVTAVETMDSCAKKVNKVDDDEEGDDDDDVSLHPMIVGSAGRSTINTSHGQTQPAVSSGPGREGLVEGEAPITARRRSARLSLQHTEADGSHSTICTTQTTSHSTMAMSSSALRHQSPLNSSREITSNLGARGLEGGAVDEEVNKNQAIAPVTKETRRRKSVSFVAPVAPGSQSSDRAFRPSTSSESSASDGNITADSGSGSGSSSSSQRSERQKRTKALRRKRPLEAAAPLIIGSETDASSRIIVMNGNRYTLLDALGKGASSVVHRVYSETDNKIYAFKRVDIRNASHPVSGEEEDRANDILNSYANEINLLHKMAGCPHIVEIRDSVVDRYNMRVAMVMEAGDNDLSHTLHVFRKAGTPVDPFFIRSVWREMLLAVDYMHEQRVVHGDLKPANFVFIKGRLKLIDFGIAKAISNDTTNITRENTIGTVNYMAPEAIYPMEEIVAGSASGSSRIKLGRASDIWSLGCILYQMLFGQPPFAATTNLLKRMHLITNPNVAIEYPAHEDLDGVSSARLCLQRSPSQRPTITTLLQHAFLSLPKVVAVVVPAHQKSEALAEKRTSDTGVQTEDRPKHGSSESSSSSANDDQSENTSLTEKEVALVLRTVLDVQSTYPTISKTDILAKVLKRIRVNHEAVSDDQKNADSLAECRSSSMVLQSHRHVDFNKENEEKEQGRSSKPLHHRHPFLDSVKSAQLNKAQAAAAVTGSTSTEPVPKGARAFERKPLQPAVPNLHAQILERRATLKQAPTKPLVEKEGNRVCARSGSTESPEKNDLKALIGKRMDQLRQFWEPDDGEDTGTQDFSFLNS